MDMISHLAASSATQWTGFSFAGKRVLFLGDSITYRGLYISYLETYLALRFPGQAFTFINCGLPSETVSGLSEDDHAGGAFPRPGLRERLDRVLALVKPDIVLACYGMNDGIFQPFDRIRFQAFQAGIRYLHKNVITSGAQIIHITPPVYDDISGRHPYYMEVLARQSEWLLTQRQKGWEVINVFEPMRQHLNERRKINPKFRLAEDGIHPGSLGHWLIAREILAGLGFSELHFQDVSAFLTLHPQASKILEFVTEGRELLRDAWLTATGHKRPGLIPGLMLPQAEAKWLDIQASIQALRSISIDASNP